MIERLIVRCKNPFRICFVGYLLAFPVFLHSQILEWVYHYPDFQDSADIAYSVIYGADGNIYSAGGSFDSTFHYYMTVVSLDRNGNERWVYKYPDYFSSSAVSIVYGADSNLYVLGKGDNYTSAALDFIIVSLTSDGIERWSFTYDGHQAADTPYGIVYGNDGNIYVCGVSRRIGGWGDFTVLSVNALGEERWVYKLDTIGSDYEVANAIDFGNDGYIYVAGSFKQPSSSAYDFGVISLDTSGNERWQYRYNGPGNWYDDAHCLSCRNDLIYAGGHSSDTQADDIIVVCLDSAGAERWIYTYDDGSTSACPWAIDIADDGDIYAAGYCHQTRSDMCCVSADTCGRHRWLYSYNGRYDWFDEARALKFVRDSIIYLAGKSVDVNYRPIFTVVCLNDSGVARWIYKYDSLGTYGDAYSIAADTLGNVYACGMHWTTIGHYDYIVLCLSNGINGISKDHVETKGKNMVCVLPNPAQGAFNIHIFMSAGTIKLYNITGQLVRQETIPFSTTNRTLVIKNLCSGVYFLSTTIGSKTDIQKLVLIK